MFRKIVAIVVSVVMMSAMVPDFTYAHSSYYINENFDLYTGNSVPYSSGFSGETANGVIESSPSYQTWGNCLKMSCTEGKNPFLNIHVSASPAKASIAFNIMFAGGDGERRLYVRDNRNKLFLLMNTTGKDILVCGNKVTEFKRIEYYEFKFNLNLSKKLCEFYVNGEKLHECAFDEAIGKRIKGFKLEQHGNGSRSAMFVDNLFIYDGDAPSIKEKELKSSDDPNVEKILEDSVAWFNNTNVMVYGGQRSRMFENEKIKTLSLNGNMFVPLKSALEVFNVEYVEADNKISVLCGEHKLYFEDGTDSLQYGKKTVELSEPVCSVDDILYIPARDVASIFEKSYFEDSHGLILISKRDHSDILGKSDELLTELIRKVCYDRPDSQQILDDYVTQGMSETHPSLLIGPDGFENIKKRIETNSAFREMYERVRKDTDKIIEMEPIKYSRSDGRRLDNAQNMYARYLTPALMMYNITGEEKYALWAWENLNVLCSDAYPEWGNASAEHLNVAELSSVVSLAYDWLYDWLGEERREIVKNALIEKGIKVGLQFHAENKWWIESTWNWNMSLAGGLSLACMAMMAEEPFLCSKLMSLSVKSAENSLSSFYPDGGWGEGLGYWNYTILNLTALVSSSDIILGTDYGIFNSPGLSLTPFLPLSMRGPAGNFNFHDTGGESHTPQIGFFAKKLEKPGLMYALYKDIQKETPQFNDLLWLDPDYMDVESSEVPLDMYYQNIDTMFMKQNLTNSAIYTGLHAGDNNAAHSHLDSGNFIIDANGERWIIDPGRDFLSYYIGLDRRFEVWALRTEAHNCIVINPDESGGQIVESVSPIIETASKDRGAYAIADLTSAYDSEIKEYKRGLMLADNRRAVIVRDEIKSDVENDIRWSVTTTVPDITIGENGKTAVLKKNNKSFWMEITEGNGTFTVKDANPLPTSPNPDGQIPRNSMKQIEICMDNVKDMSLSVAFIPLSAKETEPYGVPEALPLSEWKNAIPDGVIETPELLDIKINGQTIDGFAENVMDYIVRLTADEPLPEVSAESENAYVDIVYGGEHIKTADIFVTSKTDKSMKCVYQVAFYREAEIIELNDENRLTVKNVSVSAEPQSENGALNMIDSDFTTRWSAENEQWLMLELEEIQDISIIALAVYNGDTRAQYFDVEISEDGVNWTTVYTGATSGESAEFEAFSFEAIRGKFVRVNCHGADSSTWNSITEVAVYK